MNRSYIFKASAVAVLLACILQATCVYSRAESAEAAVTIEAQSGTVLYQNNADAQLPMASTTKIMTALITIEKCDMSDIFTVSASAAAAEGSKMGLLAGDKISVEDLLYMLLLKSANDAAEVLAENIAGSVEKFADLMNERADKMGLKHTHFVNPHGLPAEGHYTTAYELALIARVCFSNPVFRQIVSTDVQTLTYHKLAIQNSNKLLRTYEYCIGGKTGFTKAAGRCLVTAAEKDGTTLITVTLNDGDDWNDHEQLYDKCFGLVERTMLYKPGEYTAVRPVLNGKEIKITNSEPIYVVKCVGTVPKYEIIENLLPMYFAPIDKGQTAGYIAVSYGGLNSGEAEMIFAQDENQAQDKESEFKKFEYNLRRLLQTLLP